MSFSILVKSALSNILMLSGITGQRIKNHAARGEYLILMYHRIIDFDESIQPGMYVTPETFRLHLQYLQKHFSVISLNDLIDRISNHSPLLINDKPVCVLTFDDGWIDFYQNAFPILQDYDCPATVFLPTRYIDSTAQFWTDQLADILKHIDTADVLQHENPETTELLKEFKSLGGSFSEKLDYAAERLKQYSSEKICELLDLISESIGIVRDDNSRDFINWSEVAEMHQSGLISFGSHTVSHEILTTISLQKVEEELVQSKTILLENGCITNEGSTFCYPNGNFTDEISNIVKEAGYRAAVTTKNGWNHKASDMMKLNRVGLHQDISSNKALFASRLAGFF